MTYFLQEFPNVLGRTSRDDLARSKDHGTQITEITCPRNCTPNNPTQVEREYHDDVPIKAVFDALSQLVEVPAKGIEPRPTVYETVAGVGAYVGSVSYRASE